MSAFGKYTKYDYTKNVIIPDKINDFRVWKLSKNMSNENIIGKATKNQTQIKNWAEVLNEDYKNNKNNSFKTYFKTNKTKKGYEFKNYLSPNVNRIVTEVGRLVTEMKNSEENLSKLNINSLRKTKNQMQKLEIFPEEASIIKLKEIEYQKSLEKKPKKSPNYKFLSDNYRRQLNKAFMNFNPIKHLANIHSLIKDNPETEKEFRDHTKIIDNEIHNITSPNFYKKQYKKLHKMLSNIKDNMDKEDDDNNSITEREANINRINSKKNKNKNMSLPKIAYRTTMGFHPGKKYYATEAEFPKNSNIKNKFDVYQYNKKNKKRRKTENKRKFPDKEGRKKELELMEDACKEIIKSIRHFDENNENDFYYEYSKLNSDERRKTHYNILRDNKTENILLKIQKNNILKNIGDEMDIKRKKLDDDIIDYGKRIHFIKDEMIKDIEDNELKEQNNII